MPKRRREQVESRKLWDEDPLRIPLERSRKRAVILITIISFCFAVVALRLIDIMVLDHEKISERATQQYNRKKTLHSQRGIIWDRKMKEMASNIESASLYASPSKIKETRNVSRKLAPIINVSSKKLNTMLLKKSDKEFLWLARKMDRDVIRQVEAFRKKEGYKSLGFVSEPKRYYPKVQTASHVIGFTNIDNKGISGLELQYDKLLKGRKKRVSVNTDARGNTLTGGIQESVAGNSLVLTIDEGIQYIVEKELSLAMETTKAKAAVAIMMDPRTGEILAMANRPDFDPNNAGKSGLYARRNRAITDLYEPGSTMKTTLAAAAIEEGTVRLHDRFDVSKGYIVVGGKAIRDSHKSEEDVLTFKEVIQTSSNVGSVMVGQGLGAEPYYEYIKKFGFGDKSGIDLPGEVRGILRRPNDWSGTSLASLSIGQEIGVTPLQMLRVYATIANGGLLMKPYVVSDIISPSGEVVKRVKPEVVRRVVSEKTTAKVTEMLKTVVEEGGTATRANVQGNLVAGKTGTAQVFDTKAGRYSRTKFISSFVGFAPADDPKIALIVVVYEPKGSSYGGVVAAPVFKNIVDYTFAYLDIPMETDENRIVLVSKSR